MADPDPTTVTDRAYVQLRELLTSENVRPGDHLGEVAVAEWLGISRTPVRAALQRLELDQLVRRNHNSGYTVAGMNPTRRPRGVRRAPPPSTQRYSSGRRRT